MSNALIRVSTSPDATLRLGEELGRRLGGGELILLRGQLGAGKSVFARGVAQALGSAEWRGSPTFNLVHEYATRPPLYHADLYRLAAGEVPDLGLEEYSRVDAVLMVEWAERAGEYLRSIAVNGIVEVSLGVTGESERRIEVEM